jgi:UDP-glucose 4-epimerase
MSKRRVFITGAGGTVGRAAAKVLVARGYEVFGFGLGEQYYHQQSFFNALQRTGAFKFETGSIMDRFAIENAMRGVDAVIHLAAMVGGSRIERERLHCFDINVNGTNTVLAAAVASGVRHFIMASSSAVYGEPDENPVAEDAQCKPVNLYGVTKLAAEELTRGYAQLNPNLRFTIARLFSTYGDDIAGHIAINYFAACVAKGESPRISGDGEQRRCYVHADDVGEAFANMLESPAANGRTYNIGNPTQVFSLNELACKVIEIVAPKSGLKPESENAAGDSDIRMSVADISRAQAELGYSPRVTVEEGLRRMVQSSVKRIAD